MKKILAIAIVAVLTLALCISASAKVNIDRLFINLNHMDGTSVLNDDPVEIAVGDKLYILGWAYGDASNLKEMTYSLDGGANVALDDNYRDRADVAAAFGLDESFGVHAGFGHDTEEEGGLLELKGIDQLKDGTYVLTIKAIFNDGTEEAYEKDINLKVGTGVKADDPEPTQPSDPTPTNPTTADASVIAIAAVACIALAGVVVAKKVR